MKKVLSLILIASFINSGFAKPENLEGEKGENKIVVIENSSGEYIFHYYEKDTKTGLISERMLGHGSYTKEDLERISSSERTEAILKTAASVVIAGTLGYAAWYAGLIVTFGAVVFGNGAMTPAYFMAAAGASTPLWIKKLNPFRQFKQANALKKHNFINNNIIVSEEEVKKTAELLDEILN